MITAIVLMLVGAGIAVVAGGFGYLAGRRAGQAHVALPVGNVCSCGHGYGTHADELSCRGDIPRKRNGMHHLDRCPCHRYDGPEPLPRVWTPAEITAFPA